MNEECNSNGRHIKTFFEDQMERLKKEEKEVLEIGKHSKPFITYWLQFLSFKQTVEVREHAKRLLQNELQKLEASIEEARKKVSDVWI